MQPFVVDDALREALGAPETMRGLPLAAHDTFWPYGAETLNRVVGPGTVMVWRDQLGAAQHAAVTLGDGWALHTRSQGWMTPRVVLSLPEIKRAALQRGHRLSRRTITPT